MKFFFFFSFFLRLHSIHFLRITKNRRLFKINLDNKPELITVTPPSCFLNTDVLKHAENYSAVNNIKTAEWS